jgi:hypothetical protein
MDSAIDKIRMAKEADYPFLYLQLEPWPTETVELTAGTDLGTGGLVLDPATNSPPVVVIDGGNRNINLVGSVGSSLITVKKGVALTLRNITLRTATGMTLVTVEDNGGRLILEDGAVIIGSALNGPVATDGAVSYAVSRTTPGAYDEVHTFSADGALVFS